jgi:hypothetical protein
VAKHLLGNVKMQNYGKEKHWFELWIKEGYSQSV